MNREIHFLGWDAPIAEKAAEYLVGYRKGPAPIDFHDTLIVVPTLQAGRRLREVMAMRCSERRSFMLSATVVTPRHFFSQGLPDASIANPALVRIAWSRVLMSMELADYRHLFPGRSIRGDTDKFQWSLNTGEIIDRLRRELADGGYLIRDVLKNHGKDLEEIERWQDLGRLEQLYLSELKALGLKDPCTAEIERSSSPDVDPAVRRIVVAGTPDPSLLAIRAFEKLSADHRIEILVHAPESEKSSFDEWGRPVPEQWVKANVEIPDWARNVFVEVSPPAQSKRVMKLVAADETFGPFDITVGVPDLSIVSFLKNHLRAIGLPAFDPSDIQLSDHTLGRLIEYTFNLLVHPSYESVANLLRHPDFLEYLEAKHKIPPLDLLTQLDEFQNFYLPPTFERMLQPFAGNPKGTHDYHHDFTVLGKALTLIRDHLAAFEKETFEGAWRSFLKEIYGTLMVDRTKARNKDFENAAGIVEETLREMRDMPTGAAALTSLQCSAVFTRRLKEQSFHRERTDEIVDLQGWLELPWSDAPFLLVTGMNEDFVPGGSLSDAFLPDSLRIKLNLRHDLARFGRDVYLMRTLIESRRHNGRICFIAGKNGIAGDPLKPSRLMFRCSDRELIERTELFFKERLDDTPRPPTDILFRLKPGVCEEDPTIIKDKKINVTTFSSYLECPFRFYLSNVLDMEELSDEKTEIDSLDFGSIVHGVLEDMGKDEKLWASRDADELAEKLEQLVRTRAARRYGAPLPLAVQVSLESAVQRLNALAIRQVTLVEEGWQVTAVEHRVKDFEYHHGFRITGKIDRIDRNDKTGRIRIMDYKTSDAAADPEDAHLAGRKPDTPRYNSVTVKTSRGLSERKWRNLQLPLYHLLYTGAEKFNPKIELAYFNLPKAVSATGISIWESFGPDKMASAITCIKGVLEDIEKKVFWPPAETTRYEDVFERLFVHEPSDNFEIDEIKKHR